MTGESGNTKEEKEGENQLIDLDFSTKNLEKDISELKTQDSWFRTRVAKIQKKDPIATLAH